MSQLILMNGPLLCGKNIAVDHLKKSYDLTDRRCKDRLFQMMWQFFDTSEERFWELYNNRDLKEVPVLDYQVSTGAYYALSQRIDDLPDMDEVNCCLSCRNAMIYISEIVCKPTFGRTYFGQYRADKIQRDELAIDDSCGFAEELPPVIEKLGQDNILLIRVKGRGSFQGDSREYIPDGVIEHTVDIYNIYSEDVYLQDIKKTVTAWLGYAND